MTYCNNGGGGGGGGVGGGGNVGTGGSPPPQIPCSSAGTPPVASGASPTEPEDDIWRGHSIAALRRRASELNAAIPSYLQINYDTHNNASVY